MEPRFEEFIREKRYFANVSPRTIDWYESGLKWLNNPVPSQDDLKGAVIRMRTKGLKPTGCNSVIQALNSYAHWVHGGADSKCGSGCRHPKLTRLKTPEFIPPTFTESQVRTLVGWKPKGKYQQRLHLLVLFLLDTGARISEALTLRIRDIDLDNMLVKLTGKGSKDRVTAFSFALRRALHRFITDSGLKADWLLFASRNQTELGRRVVLRDVKLLCRKLGFEPPIRTLHAFRHSFALNYLRRGGSVFHLQRALGHSTLDMTRRYANLTTSDLQAVHESISLLSK